MSAKLLNLDRTVLMEVSELRRDGVNVLIKGTILGTMPITCVMSPAEGRNLLKMLSWKTLVFLMTFLFRSDQAKESAK